VTVDTGMPSTYLRSTFSNLAPISVEVGTEGDHLLLLRRVRG